MLGEAGVVLIGVWASCREHIRESVAPKDDLGPGVPPIPVAAVVLTPVPVSVPVAECSGGTGSEQEVDDVSFVRLEPVELDRLDFTDIQSIDVCGIEELSSACLVIREE